MASARASRFRAAEAAMWASVGVVPTERFLALDRTHVTVRVQEAGFGPPIVFIHGASNSGVSWASLFARLPNFRCIALDRPGCGLSDALPAPWTGVDDLTRFARDLLLDVLDALGLERAAVVSTSFGGQIALRAAAAHPERIERVVEFGYAIGASSTKLPLMMRAGAIPGLSRLAGAVPVNDRVVRSMFKRIGLRGALEQGKVTPELVRCFASMLNDTDTMRNEMEVTRTLMTWRGLDARITLDDDLLASIRVPCSFQWGEDDPFGGVDVAEPFVAKIPGARLEMVPGGHAVWIDDPDRAARAVRDFVPR